MTQTYTPEAESDSFDQYDMPNPDARSGIGGIFPRIVFVSANSDYDGTSIVGGGFMITEQSGFSAPDGWGEEITLKDGGTARVSPTLDCIVLDASPQTRRYIVNVEVEKNGKMEVVPAGHVDFESKWWREEGASSGQYRDAKGKPPKSRISMFVVLPEMPNQVWELYLKSGNANVVRDLNQGLISLAEMQTKRLKLQGRYNGANTLMSFINWVTLTSGAKMAYSPRNPGEDAGGFSRISILWPGMTSVNALKQFQRQFVEKDQFGEKVQHWKEWGAVKKMLTGLNPTDYETHFSDMCVGLQNYGSFIKMREELDDRLMNGYIRPLASFQEVETAIEAVKQRFFERSIAINGNQLPAPSPADQPEDDGLPRDEMEWEDQKQAIANGAPPPKPVQPAAAGSAGKAKASPPAKWTPDFIRQQLALMRDLKAVQWSANQLATAWTDVQTQAELRAMRLDGNASKEAVKEGLWAILKADVQWSRGDVLKKIDYVEAGAKKKAIKPDEVKALFGEALEQAIFRFGDGFAPTGVMQTVNGVMALLKMCDDFDDVNSEGVPF